MINHRLMCQERVGRCVEGEFGLPGDLGECRCGGVRWQGFRGVSGAADEYEVI